MKKKQASDKVQIPYGKKSDNTMSTLLKWAQNTTQSKTKNNANASNGTNGKTWIHPPDALQKGHIAYLVKFMGNTPVDQPKGIEVVKEGIRKLQFSAQIKKAETGAKSSRKVELTISVDGVAIQDPKSHTILHQFPLHRISYCADDKGEKRFFSFIAKQPNPDGTTGEDKHECFVFVSDKLAEEITLTIGQAFELAYKRFLDTSGKDLEAHKRALLSQQRMKRLEQENNIYKQRLLQLSQFNAIKQELDAYLRRNDIKNILEIPQLNNDTENKDATNNGTSNGQTNGTTTPPTDRLLELSINTNENNNMNGSSLPPVPPRRIIDLMSDNLPTTTPAVGTRLEGLLLNEFENDQDFDPRGFENGLNHHTNNSINTTNGNSFNNTVNNTPLLAPPPKAMKRQTSSSTTNGLTSPPTSNFDSFDSPFGGMTNTNTNNMSSIVKDPFKTSIDPFEMGDFSISATNYVDAIGLLDKKILEMKDGFSRGLSFGNDDFSLESLDPLKN